MGNLCFTSTAGSFDDTESLPSLTLYRILTVFLICFEAAIDTLPFVPPVLSTTRQAPAGFLPWLPSSVKVWEFMRDHEVSSNSIPHDFEDLPASYRQVHAALRKRNMCDHFCFFLENALRVKLEELNLGTVRWVRFNPLPRTFYVEVVPNQELSTTHLDDLTDAPPPTHSVLEITTTRGEKLIFDGTPEQFGWSDSAWTMDKQAVENYYVEGQGGMTVFPDHEKTALKVSVLERDPRPWRILFEQMEELLAELDWEAYKELDDKELWRRVRDQPRRKFVLREP